MQVRILLVLISKLICNLFKKSMVVYIQNGYMQITNYTIAGKVTFKTEPVFFLMQIASVKTKTLGQGISSLLVKRDCLPLETDLQQCHTGNTPQGIGNLGSSPNCRFLNFYKDVTPIAKREFKYSPIHSTSNEGKVERVGLYLHNTEVHKRTATDQRTVVNVLKPRN